MIKNYPLDTPITELKTRAYLATTQLYTSCLVTVDYYDGFHIMIDVPEITDHEARFLAGFIAGKIGHKPIRWELFHDNCILVNQVYFYY